MAFWLKAFGSAAKQLDDKWQTVRNGVLTKAATFAKKPMVAKGDRIVFYAAGKKLIFAAGEVTSHPYKDPTNSPEFPWRVDVKRDMKKATIHDGAVLDLVQAPSSHNDIRLRIQRRSHVQLNEDEYNAALAALK